MKFTVVVLACVLAAASAQFNQGQYFPQQNQYQNNRYNNYNPYNQFNKYNRYQNQNQNQNQNQYNPYKPYVSSTPFPRPSVTISEATATVSPVVPFIPSVSATKAPVVVPVVARVSADARSAETVKYGNEINADGTFNYFYETNNGIAAQAEGSPRNFGGNPPVIPDVIRGSYSWISPEGKPVSISYVADENGYQPVGDAIPVAPEVPAQIARALAYIARSAKN